MLTKSIGDLSVISNRLEIGPRYTAYEIRLEHAVRTWILAVYSRKLLSTSLIQRTFTVRLRIFLIKNTPLNAGATSPAHHSNQTESARLKVDTFSDTCPNNIGCTQSFGSVPDRHSSLHREPRHTY